MSKRGPVETTAASFADRFRAAIEERDVTHREVAERIGHKTPSAVTQWVNGGRVPRPKSIRALAKALDVDPIWLAGESEDSELGRLYDTMATAPRSERDALLIVMDHLDQALEVANGQGWSLYIRGDLGRLAFSAGEDPSASGDSIAAIEAAPGSGEAHRQAPGESGSAAARAGARAAKAGRPKSERTPETSRPSRRARKA